MYFEIIGSNSLEDYINYALIAATEEDDVDAVRELLIKGADPNVKVICKESENIFEGSIIEIGKLLVDYGFTLNRYHLRWIFADANADYVKEVVPYILERRKNNAEIVVDTFLELLDCDYELGQTELEIFKMLLANGLPIDDYLYDLDFDSAQQTALDLSVSFDKIDFVSSLFLLSKKFFFFFSLRALLFYYRLVKFSRTRRNNLKNC